MTEAEIKPKLEAFAKAAEKHFNPEGDSALAIVLIVADREEDGESAVWSNSSNHGTAVMLSEAVTGILKQDEDDDLDDEDDA